MIDNPVQFFIELPHGFALLGSDGLYLVTQALVRLLLVQLPPFQACDIVLQGIVSSDTRRGETEYSDDSTERQGVG